jgi:hypothetical protein
MHLTTYRACSRREKQALLQAFWSRRSHPDDKILDAAGEYGPVAFRLVAVITAELVVVALGLWAARQTFWAVVTGAAAAFSAWSTWWTRACCHSCEHYRAIARWASR